jgi:hypothetical protein
MSKSRWKGSFCDPRLLIYSDLLGRSLPPIPSLASILTLRPRPSYIPVRRAISSHLRSSTLLSLFSSPRTQLPSSLLSSLPSSPFFIYDGHSFSRKSLTISTSTTLANVKFGQFSFTRKTGRKRS